ncbi:MFS transporter [Desulfosporosinus sp. BG]|uniref:MFS transporter n=1 Tax=Desulfosporosinus sp. BG TaxID=1633135 RepID=UPI000855F957|nr:MFS transporter [Desulfosporosinus sp. BG]ODA41879.1 L-Proline/Glycine betaine transporter ProP [Desulfosporosinus sp. BG]
MEEIITGEKLWTKSFAIIMIVNIIAYTLIYMLMAILPLYILHIGGSKFMAGIISAVFTFTCFITRPWFGNLLDGKGRKTILQIGNVILLISIIGYNLFNSTSMLLILRVIQGIGWCAVSTSTSTIVSDLIPPFKRFEGIGYYGMSTSIALAIGPALGLYIVENFNYSTCYIVIAFSEIIVLALGFLLNYEQQKKGKRITKSNQSPVIFEKKAILPSAIFFFVAISYSGILTFIPSYAVYTGIKNISIFFIVFAAALFITRPTTGKIADRIGASKVILPGLVLIIISLLLLTKSTSLLMFLVAGVLYGLGYGSVQPVLNALVITFAPVERRGSANATFLAANDIGMGIGAIMWGLVSQNLGFAYIYLFSSVLIALSMIVYLVLLKHRINIHANSSPETT